MTFRGVSRGQSEALGTMLLLGLTVLGVTGAVVAGSVALSDSQDTAEIEQAEHAMTQFDSKASLVGHGESEQQHVSLGTGDGANVYVDDGGWMNITIEGPDDTEQINVSLGAVVYEYEDTTIAYQGGGVWRSDDGRSTMVSPPEFHYRGTSGVETLTLPLITVNGDGTVGDDIAIRQAGDVQGRFPTAGFPNPLVGGKVTITVESEYADGWKYFFEQRTRASVENVDDDTVTVSLLTEFQHSPLDGSMSQTGGELKFGGVKTMYADSYDSANSPHGGFPDKDAAKVQSSGDFHLSKDGGGSTEEIDIRGDLVARNIHVPDGQEDKLNVTGERREETVQQELGEVAGVIDQRISVFLDRDLPNEADRQEASIEESGGSVVLDNNTYVDGDVDLENDAELRIENGSAVHVGGALSLSNSNLTIDTGGGTVTLYVDQSLDTDGASRIDVVGGGEARILVDGQTTFLDESRVRVSNTSKLELHNTDNVEIANNASFRVDDDLSPNLWFYSSADEITFQGDQGVEYTGVFYAPQSEAALEEKMTVKGSFVFSEFDFKKADLYFHYDENLEDEQPFGGADVPVVSYLHISVHPVEVTED